jgi:hypothetical protein
MWIALQIFLFTIIVPLVTHLLKAFGIGAVVFTGMTLLIDELKSLAISQFAGLPADVISIAGIMNLDVAFNMIVSSVLASAVLKGLDRVTGTKKAFVLKA